MCDSIYCAYTLIFLCIVLYMFSMKRIKMVIICAQRIDFITKFNNQKWSPISLRIVLVLSKILNCDLHGSKKHLQECQQST